MKIVADENIDSLLVRLLKQEGHDLRWISKENPSIDDSEVLAFALEHDSLLLTEDKVFGEKVYRDSHASAGVLLLRIHQRSRQEAAVLAVTTVREHGIQLIGKFSVLTNRSFEAVHCPHSRIRRIF